MARNRQNYHIKTSGWVRKANHFHSYYEPQPVLPFPGTPELRLALVRINVPPRERKYTYLDAGTPALAPYGVHRLKITSHTNLLGCFRYEAERSGHDFRSIHTQA